MLLPLDAEILRNRLVHEDFRLSRLVDATMTSLHFGPQFPGDALVLYPRLLASVTHDGARGDGGIEHAVVDGSYVVVERALGEVVGQIGTMGPAGAEVEIGYGINSAFRRRGIATEAVSELISLLAAGPQVRRLTARTAATNRGSSRVLEKNGFARTGSEVLDGQETCIWALEI